MPLIIVSADDFGLEEKVCARVAEDLGFRHVGREILADVSQKHQVSKDELLRTLTELPGFMTRRNQRKRMLTFIEEACLERLLEDGVVCHGLGAHLYIRGVSHVLKVRIINDSDQWAQALAKGKRRLAGKGAQTCQAQHRDPAPLVPGRLWPGSNRSLAL